MTRTTTGNKLAKQLAISPARAIEAAIKAQLISEVIKASKNEGLTHAQIAELSGLPRSAFTGILSGSLQKVTIDRVLRLVEAVNLTAEIKVRKAA